MAALQRVAAEHHDKHDRDANNSNHMISPAPNLALTSRLALANQALGGHVKPQSLTAPNLHNKQIV